MFCLGGCFFLSSFTRCLIKWRWYWVFLLSRFRLSWDSSMGRISNEFLSGILESCWWFSLIFLFLPVCLTVIKYYVLLLASWVFICWTDNNSITLSKDSDSILSLLFSFCNNSSCYLIYSVCTVSCPVTFSHNRRSILSILSGFRFLEISYKMLHNNHFVSDFGKLILVGWLNSRRCSFWWVSTSGFLYSLF